jgi:hypothetical protein
MPRPVRGYADVCRRPLATYCHDDQSALGRASAGRAHVCACDHDRAAATPADAAADALRVSHPTRVGESMARR